MKTLFFAVNSKYIHTLLAPRYLIANIKNQINFKYGEWDVDGFYDGKIELYETNINNNYYNAIKDIYNFYPDVIAVSCYIFNIEYIIKIIKEIKHILPKTKIIFGGYEAAFGTERFHGIADVIIKGEGDFIFGRILNALEKGYNVPYIVDGNEIHNLDSLISPYTKEYGLLGENKILYYESSRGCPFSCSYCMSSNTMCVRYFSFERTKNDIDMLMLYHPKQIKFVDRTFNGNINRAISILNYLEQKYGEEHTNFHFEVAPELFNDELLSVIKSAPKGLFQFEIGIQTFNKDALSAINRKANVDKIFYNVKQLISYNNAHIHTDLIAGLPYENFDSFVIGFNRLFILKSHCIQLGFLKILHGSAMEKDKANYIVSDYPPYEIYASKWLSFEEILKLKTAEKALELYYNSGRFINTINYIIDFSQNVFNIFYELGIMIENHGEAGLSAYKQSDIIFEYGKLKFSTNLNFNENKFIDLINADFIASGNPRMWRRHQ